MDPNFPQPAPVATGMVDRVRRIILEPAAEWGRIAMEPMTVKGIMTGWAVPLAAIGPVATLIGGALFGYNLGFIAFRPSITSLVVQALIMYGLSLLSVWVLSLIIDGLAPSFGGTKDKVAAMKVAAFSWTAAWLAGVFHIIPMLGILSIVGLYSFYLLYLGLPLLMRSPTDKAIGYVIVSVVAAGVLIAVVGAIASSITWRMMSPMATLGSGSPSGTVSVAGLGSVDLGKLDAASKQIDAAAKQLDTTAASGAGAATPVAPAVLAAMLPGSIGGWTRSEIESSGGSAGGVGGSSASAKYSQGSDTMTLTVSDIGAMGALASLGKALNVETNKQTEHGYERTGNVDGRMTTQNWDSANKSGEYSTIVADRFTISASGHAPDDSQLKAAVATIDMGKLAALAPK